MGLSYDIQHQHKTKTRSFAPALITHWLENTLKAAFFRSANIGTKVAILVTGTTRQTRLRTQTMTEELGNLDLEDFLKPACYSSGYMDDYYEAEDVVSDADYENLYALPC
jgi:hypothetical protein